VELERLAAQVASVGVVQQQRLVALILAAAVEVRPVMFQLMVRQVDQV
jgi:hypothetical protein